MDKNSPSVLAFILPCIACGILLGVIGTLSFFGMSTPKTDHQPVRGLHDPQPGEQWVFLCQNSGPWECAERWTVSIREVQDGWVRYDREGGWTDQRMRLDSFVWIYGRIQDPETYKDKKQP